MPELVFSCDVEDPRPHAGLPKRYPVMTEKILDWLAEANIRGSFFFVGEVAQAEPALVRRALAQGHEIGFHSMHHQPLSRQTPAEFRSQTCDGKQMLEDITGQPVVGYRAPSFSLTRQSLWAVEILSELGFSYSSSVLPAGNPLYGLPGAPMSPFYWHTGLLELPAPITSLGAIKIPFLGGFYLRYLPLVFIRRCLQHSPANQVLWSYCHPYDFDAGQPFYQMKDTPLWVSLLLWKNRSRTFNKLNALLTNNDLLRIGLPFAEQLRAGHYRHAPTIDRHYFT